MPINCVGIFCEDIREETGGTHTIVGVMPQNIGISPAPESEAGGSLLFPKIGIYIRVHFDISDKPDTPIAARVVIPGVPDLHLGEMGIEALNNAVADAVSKNNPIVGIIFKAVATPVQLRESGTAKALVRISGEEIECATLNIEILR
ncbi:MAG TPA: hypothetical protein VGO49_01005 [Bradyrhizobium sp.]|jgi:hypothetical protein|nr:hypothetical protein [Bradyrhizobium sp.]